MVVEKLIESTAELGAVVSSQAPGDQVVRSEGGKASLGFGLEILFIELETETIVKQQKCRLHIVSTCHSQSVMRMQSDWTSQITLR